MAFHAFPDGFNEWNGNNDEAPDLFNSKLTFLLQDEMCFAIGEHAMYPTGYRTSLRCHDTRVMVEAARSSFNEHFGVNETGGTLLVKNKLALALACAYYCARANLKDRLSDPGPRLHPESERCIDTRDAFYAARMFWRVWRPVLKIMSMNEPLNREYADILEKIAEDGDEDADMASVFEWIREEGVYDWMNPGDTALAGQAA